MHFFQVSDRRSRFTVARHNSEGRAVAPLSQGDTGNEQVQKKNSVAETSACGDENAVRTIEEGLRATEDPVRALEETVRAAEDAMRAAEDPMRADKEGDCRGPLCPEEGASGRTKEEDECQDVVGLRPGVTKTSHNRTTAIQES